MRHTGPITAKISGNRKWNITSFSTSQGLSNDIVFCFFEDPEGSLWIGAVLSGTDRMLGILFGFCRGAVLVGVAVMGGQFAGFDNDDWWDKSFLIDYGEFVADWIRVMAPKGMDMLQPGDLIKSIPIKELT